MTNPLVRFSLINTYVKNQKSWVLFDEDLGYMYVGRNLLHLVYIVLTTWKSEDNRYR